MNYINLKLCTVAGTQIYITESTGQSEFTNRKYEIENYYSTLPLSLSPLSGVIIDTGARCGIEAIYFAKKYPHSKVIALEGDQKLFSELKSNVEANLLNNVTCLNVLVGDQDEDASKDVYHVSFGTANLHDVKRVSSASLLKSLGMPHIQLLKVAGYKAAGTLITSLTAGSVSHVCGFVDIGDVWLPDLRRRLCEISYSYDIRITGMAESSQLKGKFDEIGVPDLTVIIPVYNVEKYVEKCLLSIVSNKKIAVEILAVDDGSTDRSGEIIRRVAKIHSNIKHVVKANGGCASARNHGLRMATGRYVAFVDGDDWVSSEGLSRAVRLSCLDDPDVVSFGYIKCYETTGTKKYFDGSACSPRRDMLIKDYNIIREFAYAEPSIWRKIYKRNFLLSNQIEFKDSIKRFDDLPFNFLVFMKVSTMRVLPEAHYYYRLGREGQDIAITDSRLHTIFDIFNYLFENVRSMNSDEIMFRFLVVFISTHNWAWKLIDESLKDEYLELCNMQYSNLKLGNLCDMTEIANFSKSHKEFIKMLKIA